MAQDNLSIREFLAKLDNGDFDVRDRDVQIEAGWYDWFCADESLMKKTKALGRRLKRLLGGKKINLDDHYVFFKNNCPVNGRLYDDFRICDKESGDVIYTITPKTGHAMKQRRYEAGELDGLSELWGKENDFKEPIIAGKWQDIVNHFIPIGTMNKHGKMKNEDGSWTYFKKKEDTVV